MPADAAEDAFRRKTLVVIPFDEASALASAALKAETKDKGLSLGDRACLALAGSGKVFTCDRRWLEIQKKVDAKSSWRVESHQLRQRSLHDLGCGVRIGPTTMFVSSGQRVTV